MKRTLLLAMSPLAFAIACGSSGSMISDDRLQPEDAVEADTLADIASDAGDGNTRDATVADGFDPGNDGSLSGDDSNPDSDPGEADVPIPVDAFAFDAEVPFGDAVEVSSSQDISAFQPDVAGLSNLSCKEFYRQCVAQCPLGTNDLPEPACFDACRPTLSAEGASTLDAFVACLQTSGCELMTDATARLTCYGEACGTTYTACFHGDLGCGDVLTCAQACPQGDSYSSCVVACSQDGTVDSQALIVKILQCIAAACCPDNSAACNTPEGKTCTNQVFQLGGACFGLGVQCVSG